MTDIVERLREETSPPGRLYSLVRTEYVREAAEEIERLLALVLDACEAFDLYDLPHQAFHYRREVLGLDAAKKIARTHLTT